MNWVDIYRSRVTTAEEAVKVIRSGHRVWVHPGCNTPTLLINAMVDRAPELENVEVVTAPGPDVLALHVRVQDIVARAAFKPTSSIRLGGRTVDVDGAATDVITKGRHDPCVGIRAVPIAEAMLAIVLLDHALRQRGQNGDVQPATPVIPG